MEKQRTPDPAHIDAEKTDFLIRVLKGQMVGEQMTLRALGFLTDKDQLPSIPDPNACDDDGTPLLVLACQADRDLSARILFPLLWCGADTNQPDAHGRTALFYVRSHKDVERLIHHGADIAHRDADGVDALTFTRERFKQPAANATEASEQGKACIALSVVNLIQRLLETPDTGYADWCRIMEDAADLSFRHGGGSVEGKTHEITAMFADYAIEQLAAAGKLDPTTLLADEHLEQTVYAACKNVRFMSVCMQALEQAGSAPTPQELEAKQIPQRMARAFALDNLVRHHRLRNAPWPEANDFIRGFSPDIQEKIVEQAGNGLANVLNQWIRGDDARQMGFAEWYREIQKTTPALMEKVDNFRQLVMTRQREHRSTEKGRG